MNMERFLTDNPKFEENYLLYRCLMDGYSNLIISLDTLSTGSHDKDPFTYEFVKNTKAMVSIGSACHSLNFERFATFSNDYLDPLIKDLLDLLYKYKKSLPLDYEISKMSDTDPDKCSFKMGIWTGQGVEIISSLIKDLDIFQLWEYKIEWITKVYSEFIYSSYPSSKDVDIFRAKQCEFYNRLASLLQDTISKIDTDTDIDILQYRKDYGNETS